MTFSLLARCAQTGAFGIIISSSSVCVTSRCAWIRANVGAIAVQNVPDPRLGPMGLHLMERGFGASFACEMLVSARKHAEYRQLALVDEDGGVGCYTGTRGLGIHAAATGPQCIAIGNLLKSKYVVEAMVDAYAASSTEEPLAERLLRGLEAGYQAGAEADAEVRAAGILVADHYTWPTVDLRVDWHDHPVQELRAIWEIFRPQMENFVTRAVDPPHARLET